MASESRIAERITVNLTEKSSRALASAAQHTEDSRTDTVNKALLVYNMLVETMANGGFIYVRQGQGKELERLILI